jgi:hypothetical protein
MTARKGDLVITEDGYYGIVVRDDTVLLANGLEEVFDDLADLKVCPINANETHGSAANFIELVRAFYD